MDDETIAIQLEIKLFAQFMSNFKKVVQVVNGLTQAERDLARATKQANDEMKKQQSLAGGSRGGFDPNKTVRMMAQSANRTVKMNLGQMTKAAGGGNIGGMLSGAGSAAMSLGMDLAVVGAVSAMTAMTAGAALAGAALLTMAKMAADAGEAFANIHLTSGATQEQTGLLSIYGKAIGQDLGAMSRDFGDTISHGGAATVFAGNAGITHFGTFDTTNTGAKFLKWLKYLDTLPESEAIRQAGPTHTAAALQFRAMSVDMKTRLAGDARLSAQVIDPQFQRESADFQAAMARMGEALTNLTVTVIKPLMPIIIASINLLADMLQGFARQMNIVAQYSRIGLDVLTGNTTKAMKDAADMIPLLMTPDKNADDYMSALDRNTRAQEDNTMAIKNGIFGAGERARGAVPPKWIGMNSDRYISEAMRLGAFSL